MFKEYFIRLLNSFSDIIPLDSYINLTSQNIILPSYHTISNKELLHIKHLYKIKNERQFKNDLEYILKYYKPIEFNELIKVSKNNTRIKENYFWLSFDDGLSEIYDVIAPILKNKGIPFGIFVNSGFIDNKDLFYRFKASLIIEKIKNFSISEITKNEIKKLLISEKAFYLSIINSIYSVNYNNKYILDSIAELIEINFKEYLAENKPYLTTCQINELIKQGVTIGSHSIDHPKYSDINFEEQFRQTNESIDYIKSNFNISHKIFAFPFTDYSVKKEFFNKIYGNNILDYSFGSAGLKHEQFPEHLQRLSMDVKNIKASKLISTEYLYYLLKKPIGKNYIIRK